MDSKIPIEMRFLSQTVGQQDKEFSVLKGLITFEEYAKYKFTFRIWN